MQDVINIVQRAYAPDATAQDRTAGVAACRALLADLEPVTEAPTPSQSPIAGIAELAAVLRGMPMEQILDMAIVKLRAAVPDVAQAPRAEALSIPFVATRRS